jgi:hypothetical protein
MRKAKYLPLLPSVLNPQAQALKIGTKTNATLKSDTEGGGVASCKSQRIATNPRQTLYTSSMSALTLALQFFQSNSFFGLAAASYAGAPRASQVVQGWQKCVQDVGLMPRPNGKRKPATKV